MSDVAASPPSPRGDTTPDLTGRTLGDYRLLRRLGSGGMGQVYLAEQLSLKREVALKLIRFDVADAETAMKRFQVEAETVARLNHPNIVQIYQLGEANGFRFMVLEYVEGRNLRHYLERKGPPDLPICLSIIRQVALALQKAHEVGVVHRDIKPENILLTRRVEVKVADFGLSRFFTPQQPALHLTQSGVTVGTPLYMSPEQVQGHPVDHRSDIYSFGVTCYHLLAGEPPFQGKTAFDVALKHVKEEPPPLAAFRPDLPPELVAMVHKMMAKRPEDRYQSVREILRDLSRIREKLTQSADALAPAAAEAWTQTQTNSRGQTESQAPPAAQPTAAYPKAVPAHRQRWRRYGVAAVFAGLLLGIALAVLSRSFFPAPHTTDEHVVTGNTAMSDGGFRYPAIIVPRREQELVAIINRRNSKTDELIHATTELVALYVQQGRLDEAVRSLELLEQQFPERNTIPKGEKGFFPKGEKVLPVPRTVALICRLGKAAVEAFRPDPEAARRSNEMFLKALEFAAIPPKNPKFDRWDRGLIAVHPIFIRYPALGELCHAALDRNALAAGVATLTPPVLEQLRQPPRLARGKE